MAQIVISAQQYIASGERPQSKQSTKVLDDAELQGVAACHPTSPTVACRWWYGATGSRELVVSLSDTSDDHHNCTKSM